jgi:hypothetical protein
MLFMILIIKTPNMIKVTYFLILVTFLSMTDCKKNKSDPETPTFIILIDGGALKP